jgi:4-hydroxysphinganine ceramide fatty acyl 2-hydroxylase
VLQGGWMLSWMKNYDREEISKHISKDNGGVWVSYDGFVLDVTDFMHDHPGGTALIERFGGKDITAIYASDKYHIHSKTSMSILQSLIVGAVEGHSSQGTAAGAMSLSSANYSESSKFIDINQPIVPQLLRLKCTKQEYMLQIHRPRHCVQTARIFQSDFMEFFTHTPWYVIPIVWGSLAAFMTSLSLKTLTVDQSLIAILGGILTWTIIEYVVHRFVFHQEALVPDHPIFFTAHFLTHALHHFLPMEK